MSLSPEAQHQIDALTARAGHLEREISSKGIELGAARRNAQIEAALERVRTRTMAMRRSDEIGSILGSIFAELQSLEMAPAHCVMWIFHEDEAQTEWFLANPETESGAASYMVDHTDHPVFQAYIEAWRERREMWVYRLEGELKRTWDDYLFSNGLSALPPPAQEAMRSLEGVWLSNTFGDFGLLTAASHEPLEPADRDIIQRFGRVFQQSYARFLDVRKAEDQAREAEIQASLERVRSRAMAMQHSDDLSGVVNVIFDELELSFREQICIFINHDPATGDLEWWSTGMGAGELPQSYRIPNLEEIRNHAMVRRYLKDLEEGTQYSVFELSGETKRSWDELLFSVTELRRMPEETKAAMRSFPKVFLSDAYLPNAMLEIAGPEPLSEEQAEVLQRFARVVEFSYTRVADLQKAEEKAREARIEAALERVRTRTMAMRQSAEIGSIVGSMFSELQNLDVALARCFIWIFHEDEAQTEWFGAIPEADAAATSFRVDYTDHPVHNAYYEAWRERRSMWLYTLEGDLKVSWEDYIFGNGLSELPPPAQEGMRGPSSVHLSNTFGDFGLLMAGSPEPLPNESLDIIQRFGRVFQQSYARFQDVRQAEIQAREARIEAAAERVRVAAMTMQTPDDLFGVVGSIREEVFGLDIPHCIAAGVTIVDSDDKACLWDVTKVEGADDKAIITRLEYEPGDVVALDRVVASWRSNPEWGVEEFDYEQLLRLADEVTVLNAETGTYMRQAIEEGLIPRLWNSQAGFSHGFVHGDFTAVPGDDARQILIKMAGVFDLAYQRYLDLQIAEASAREARIEAAFERIRSRALAMQVSDEMSGVALELRNQMALLGEDFEGIAIHRYPTGEFDEFESWAAMQAPGQPEPFVMKISFRTSSCAVLREFRDLYRSDQDEYTIKVEAATARGREWFGAVREASPEYASRLDAWPVPDWEYENCCDYSGGTIVMVTYRPIHEEQRDLLRRAARVFDLAHQRYLDLTKAEEDYQALLAEKARTEAALTDLRATQKQLVEQEKLASLGQLTAGIAHEIKNPLNFVNNFAEVSAELADELREAIENGDQGEAVELLTDLRDNAAQIAKHGKRADSIVRSMMQHARGSTSDREAVDVNEFVGEYADLAWHGMRARYQEFRADVLRELAPDAGSMTCMPQELGRVLLNLFNNAFDAVREIEDGEVTVRTSRSDGGILIEVCDNGPGVPEAIREKVFDPFFTTKPTGMGTGLGLSLSYDIVTKGHGGSMAVSEGENGGAVFAIALPG